MISPKEFNEMLERNGYDITNPFYLIDEKNIDKYDSDFSKYLFWSAIEIDKFYDCTCGYKLDGKIYTPCSIANHEHEVECKSIKMIQAESYEYHKFSSFTYPLPIIKELFGLDSHSFIIERDGEKYSRSTLTYKEYLMVENKLGKEKCEELIQKVVNLSKFEEETYSKEYPFEVFLHSLDDSSYAKYFSTSEEAFKFVEELEKQEPVSSDFICTNMIFMN